MIVRRSGKLEFVGADCVHNANSGSVCHNARVWHE